MKNLVAMFCLIVGCFGCNGNTKYTIYHYRGNEGALIYRTNFYKIENSEFVQQDDDKNATIYYQTVCEFKDLQNNLLTVICGDIKVVKNN